MVRGCKKVRRIFRNGTFTFFATFLGEAPFAEESPWLEEVPAFEAVVESAFVAGFYFFVVFLSTARKHYQV